MLKYLSSLRPAVLHGSGAHKLPFLFDPLKNSWLSGSSGEMDTPTSIRLKTLRILTWNVNFAAPDPPLRMRILLTHLQSLLSEEFPPAIILFQEVHTSALNFLLTHAWVRNNFAVTDTALPLHSGTYGTVTLVAKHLVPSVSSCFRLPFRNSEMGRDGLFVDLGVVTSQPADTTSQDGRERDTAGGELSGIFRVGNTHLESLQGNARPEQLTAVRDALKMPGVYAGIVGGDMNAIATEDEDLPQRVGMRDLWVKQEGGRGGQTWGYQPSCRFAPGRLDKILAVGNVGLAGNSRIEHVGIGLKISPQPYSRPCYATDHYGLLGNIQLGHV